MVPDAVSVQIAMTAPHAKLPSQAHPGEDAGWDLFALDDVWIGPRQWADVRSGIAIALPPGWYCRIVNRSSSFRKKGLLIIEGICDAGYRGEQLACAINMSDIPYEVKAGESIAQLVIQRVPLVHWAQVGNPSMLEPSARGHKGFGSSG